MASTAYDVGPLVGMRLFVKGVDISDLVTNLRIDSAPDDFVSLTVELRGAAMRLDRVGNEQWLRVGELPEAEFLALMAELRLRVRESS